MLSLSPATLHKRRAGFVLKTFTVYTARTVEVEDHSKVHGSATVYLSGKLGQNLIYSTSMLQAQGFSPSFFFFFPLRKCHTLSVFHREKPREKQAKLL